MREMEEFPLGATFKKDYHAWDCFFWMQQIRNLEPSWIAKGDLRFTFSAFGITAKKSAVKIVKRFGGELVEWPIW